MRNPTSSVFNRDTTLTPNQPHARPNIIKKCVILGPGCDLLESRNVTRAFKAVLPLCTFFWYEKYWDVTYRKKPMVYISYCGTVNVVLWLLNYIVVLHPWFWKTCCSGVVEMTWMCCFVNRLYYNTFDYNFSYLNKDEHGYGPLSHQAGQQHAYHQTRIKTTEKPAITSDRVGT